MFTLINKSANLFLYMATELRLVEVALNIISLTFDNAIQMLLGPRAIHTKIFQINLINVFYFNSTEKFKK